MTRREAKQDDDLSLAEDNYNLCDEALKILRDIDHLADALSSVARQHSEYAAAIQQAGIAALSTNKLPDWGRSRRESTIALTNRAVELLILECEEKLPNYRNHPRAADSSAYQLFFDILVAISAKFDEVRNMS